MQPARRITVLFLCSRNACRSQMAEGWTRHLKGAVLEPWSAGLDPAGVDPRAVLVMREAGVDISTQHSKHVSELLDLDFDYVVTVCDAAREACPVFPAATAMVHVSFEDPARASGTEEQVLAVFRRVCDEIKAFVLTLPESLVARPR